jgi:hypothetical protein
MTTAVRSAGVTLACCSWRNTEGCILPALMTQEGQPSYMAAGTVIGKSGSATSRSRVTPQATPAPALVFTDFRRLQRIKWDGQCRRVTLHFQGAGSTQTAKASCAEIQSPGLDR